MSMEMERVNTHQDMDESTPAKETDNEEKGSLGEYDRRVEGMKEELKRLKKIKKRQKKINKLEKEKMDVLREIERRKAQEKKLGKHKKH